MPTSMTWSGVSGRSTQAASVSLFDVLHDDERTTLRLHSLHESRRYWDVEGGRGPWLRAADVFWRASSIDFASSILMATLRSSLVS